jgi:hypothetical protein
MNRGPAPGAARATKTMVEKAADAWGDVPDWIAALAAVADRDGLRGAEKRVGYSASAISTVINGRYAGDMNRVEAVRFSAMSSTARSLAKSAAISVSAGRKSHSRRHRPSARPSIAPAGQAVRIRPSSRRASAHDEAGRHHRDADDGKARSADRGASCRGAQRASTARGCRTGPTPSRRCAKGRGSCRPAR